MPLELEENTTAPGTPPANIVVIYAKADGRLYGKDDTGTEFALGLAVPVSIANGGTGATTAGGALASLGAAASGANSDITSLSGLTTPLSIAQGGTGNNSATAAFNALSPLTTKGDILSNDGTNDVRLAVGSNGQVLTADSTQSSGVKWATPSSGGSVETTMTLTDDFHPNFSTDGTGALGWNINNAGTASAVTRKSGVSGHPGIITIRPGTGATGRAAISLGADGFDFFPAGDGSIDLYYILRSNQTLSAFEMLVCGLGTANDTQGDQANGIYFQLLSSDTNWHLVTANASTRTRVDTGIAYAANTWYKLQIQINDAGTSVQALINGATAGSAITTNIPTVALSPLVKVDGVAGGTASDTDIDLFYMTKTISTARY